MSLDHVHRIDLDFKATSAFLREVLKKYFINVGGNCLDVPCGNGRNIFLLSKYFTQVTGVDIEGKYIDSIVAVVDAYDSSTIQKLEQRDILIDGIEDLCNYDLICNIHFYEIGLTEVIINEMKTGAFLLLETPTCSGGNYQQLPTNDELNRLIDLNKVLELNFRPCNHKENKKGTGSAQMLIQKV